MAQENILTFLDISSFNSTPGAFILGPVADRDPADRAAAEWQCTGQKIRSRGRAQNFNVAGLIVVIVVSASILLVGLLLEPCIALLWRLRKTQTVLTCVVEGRQDRAAGSSGGAGCDLEQASSVVGDDSG